MTTEPGLVEMRRLAEQPASLVATGSKFGASEFPMTLPDRGLVIRGSSLVG